MYTHTLSVVKCILTSSNYGYCIDYLIVKKHIDKICLKILVVLLDCYLIINIT